MKKINVRLLGQFKKYVPNEFIEIFIEDECTVGEVKDGIQRYLKSKIQHYAETSLVFESALATESEILNDETIIVIGENYALLPPVCGG